MSDDKQWQRSMRHIKTTNQRIQQMKALGGTGAVRTVSTNAKLYAGYQRAMAKVKGRLGKIAGQRGKFNVVRTTMGNDKSLKLNGRPFHHFKYPINQYPTKALNPNNLMAAAKGPLRAGSFKPAHIQLHQIFGGKNLASRGQMFSKMAWGKQMALQRYFSFMNVGDRVSINKVPNQKNGIITSRIKAFNAQQLKQKSSGVGSRISSAVKNSAAAKAGMGLKSAISGAMKLSSAGKLAGAGKASGVGKGAGVGKASGVGKGAGSGKGSGIGKGSGTGKPPGGGVH